MATHQWDQTFAFSPVSGHMQQLGPSAFPLPPSAQSQPQHYRSMSSHGSIYSAVPPPSSHAMPIPALPYLGPATSVGSGSGKYTALTSADPKYALQSKIEHFLSVWLPMAYFAVLLGATWSLTIYTQTQPDQVFEVRSAAFYNFGAKHPTLLVAIYTFISSVLNSMLLWSFAQAITCFAREKMMNGSSINLRGLTAFTSAKDGAFPMQTFGRGWTWLCLVCWISLITTVTGFNTVILPVRTSVSQPITADELDLASPSFLSFYRSVNKQQYYDCSRWTDTRGFMLSPCPAGTAFTAIVYSGVAQYESAEQQALTYPRLGPATFARTTLGALPFTSFLSTESNAVQTTETFRPFPLDSRKYSIALELQGIDLDISCSDLPTSPIRADGVACNPNTPSLTDPPALHMRAAYCNSSTSSGNFDFHVRFYGDYIHTDERGNPHNENITCSITPRYTTLRSSYTSPDRATWLTRKSTSAVATALPSLLVEHILQTLVSMMVTFSQNTVDNLFAETVVQLTTSYVQGDYAAWPTVLKRQLEGMVAYLASYERLLAEDYVRRNNINLPRIARYGTLSHDAFAYSVNYLNYLFCTDLFALFDMEHRRKLSNSVHINCAHSVLPITAICLLGTLLLLWSRPLHRKPRFDPMSLTSLVVAASAGSLDLYDSARQGAAPNDEIAFSTRVSFEQRASTGAWGLVGRS